jgi:hypothetical protein
MIIAARIDHEGDRMIPRGRIGRPGARDHPIVDCGITDILAVDLAIDMATMFSWLWSTQRVANGVVRYISITVSGV